jgi:osmoprotectant transport system ATP-binding protein
MFRLASVRKSYEGKLALEDISLVTPAGRTTALIGPSGCGKSTVLGLMTGLLMPDSGVITFEGEPIDTPRLASIRRRIGYVIQDGGLFPHLTGLANVTLMARHLGWPREKVRGRVDELSSLARLSPELLLRYPAEISGGQRQRVSLMRALMLDADVLLLDEPLAALDPMVRAELQEDLSAIFQRLNKTVVIVTHDINEAAFFADQIVLLRAGKVVQSGTAQDLFERPAEAFVGQFVRAQQQGRVRAGECL